MVNGRLFKEVQPKQITTILHKYDGEHTLQVRFFWLWLGLRNSIFRNDYNSYKTNYNSGKPYYENNASTGNYSYGTRSAYQKTKRTSFASRKAQNKSS